MQLAKFEQEEETEQIEIDRLMLANMSTSEKQMKEIRIDDGQAQNSIDTSIMLDQKMQEIENKINNNDYDIKASSDEGSVKIEDVPQNKDSGDLFFATEIETHYRKEEPPKPSQSAMNKTIDESMNMQLE